jgi:RNA polymerase sigma-70 factor (ECF subfamily)
MRSKQARHDQIRGDSLDDATAAELPDANLAGPDRLAQSAEIDRRVQAALRELSPLERAAFTLRHYEGRSIDEISAALVPRTSAAKHSVFRAVRKLRVALAPLRSLES